MSEDVLSGYTFAALRPPHENPRDMRCRLALQRLCGTCRHYPGTLQDAAGTARACGYFQTETTARRRASTCRRWERKGQADV